MTEHDPTSQTGPDTQSRAEPEVTSRPSMGRFQTMVTAFDSQLDNYDTIKNTALHPIALVILVAGLFIIVCGIWAFMADRERDEMAAKEA